MKGNRNPRAQPRLSPSPPASLWPGLQRALTAAFIFTLPLLLYIKNTEYGYTKTVYAFWLISLLLTLWGVQAWRAGRLSLHLPALVWPGLALVVAGALSLLNATSLGAGLQSLAVLAYFGLFYLYLANQVVDQTSFQLYLGVVLLAVLGASLYGVLQYEGVLPGYPGIEHGEGAVISSLGNRNYLAGFVSILVVPGLGLALRLWPRWTCWLVFLSVGVGGYALLLTRTAGASLGLGAALGVVLIGWGLRRLEGHRRSLRAVGLGTLALALLLGTVLALTPSQPTASTPAWSAPLIQLKGDLLKAWAQNSGQTRAWDWWVGFEMFKAHPLLGVGLGNYKVDFLEYKATFLQTERGQRYKFPIQRAAQAHNDYVQAAAEMGLLGVAAVLFLLGGLGRSALRGCWRSDSDRGALLTLYAGVAAYLVHALVSFPAHLPASSLSLVLLLGLAHSRYLSPPGRSLRLSGRGLRGVVLVLAGLGLALSVLAYRDWRADLHLDLGNTYMRRGLYRLAREEYEKGLALDFQPAEVLYRLGDVNRLLDEPEQAERYFERSLRSFPTEETWLYLAVLKFQRQDYPGAQGELARLLATWPGPEVRREAENLSAVTQVRAGDISGGIEKLVALTEEYPDFEKLYVSLGDAWIARYQRDQDPEDRQRAKAYYQRGLEVVEGKLASNEARWERLQARLARGESVPARQGNSLRTSLDYLKGVREEILKVLERLP